MIWHSYCILNKSNTIKESFCVKIHGYATLEGLKWKNHSDSLYLQRTATAQCNSVGLIFLWLIEPGCMVILRTPL